MQAVFTDIDETLTTSDDEWLAQLMDPEHDPAMRPAADTLITGYADLGYAIYYVTARGESITLGDGRTAREATADWLEAHDFPLAEGALYLAPGMHLYEQETIAYKQGVLEDLGDDGWIAEYAYGNAETDILAFQAAGVPDERIFLVGELAGTMGVEPIPDEDAFVTHVDQHLPMVAEASCE